MGVMACYRKGCDGIMCHTYIDDIGYVCYDCQREFYDYLSKNSIVVTTEREIKNELKIFMKTDKRDSGNYIEISVEDFFRKNTNN